MALSTQDYFIDICRTDSIFDTGDELIRCYKIVGGFHILISASIITFLNTLFLLSPP